MLDEYENSVAPRLRGVPVDPPVHGSNKYGSAGLVLSSAGRGWSGLSAELRNHRKAVTACSGYHSYVEICADLIGNESLVTRRAAGFEDRQIARRGTIWLCRPGWQEGSLEIAEDQVGILHIYLPVSQFSPSKLGSVGPKISALRYERAFEDPLLFEIARAVGSELQAQTSAGSLLVEALAGSLTARLVQKHFGSPSNRFLPRPTGAGLDQRRLCRVLDYVEGNLEGDLTIDRMASIACLSSSHFTRAFTQAVGQSPHRYVSAKRLDHAKTLLTQGDRPLVEIALALGFSCQANFTRAFKQATGQAPGQFRHNRGSR